MDIRVIKLLSKFIKNITSYLNFTYIKKIFVVTVIVTSTSNSHAIIIEKLYNHASFLTDKRICYYPGSFDPFHFGHESFIRALINKNICDYVLVQALWGNDNYKKRSDISIRLKMLESLFVDDPNVMITFLPPKKLQALLTTNTKNNKVIPKYNQEFIGCIGSDVASWFITKKNSLREKKQLTKISSTYMRGIKIDDRDAYNSIGNIIGIPAKSFIIAKRSQDTFPEKTIKIIGRPIISIINEDIYSSVSSSMIKEKIRNKIPIDGLLHQKVIKIIMNEGLYRER